MVDLPLTNNSNRSFGESVGVQRTPHVVGDLIGVHILGTSGHMGTVQQTSTTVLVGGIGICRLMDKGNCGYDIGNKVKQFLRKLI